MAVANMNFGTLMASQKDPPFRRVPVIWSSSSALLFVAQEELGSFRKNTPMMIVKISLAISLQHVPDREALDELTNQQQQDKAEYRTNLERIYCNRPSNSAVFRRDAQALLREMSRSSLPMRK